jgi:hypothetical protein
MTYLAAWGLVHRTDRSRPLLLLHAPAAMRMISFSSTQHPHANACCCTLKRMDTCIVQVCCVYVSDPPSDTSFGETSPLAGVFTIPS